MTSKTWTVEDLDTLKSHSSNVSSFEELCILLNRTRRSILHKCKIIGLSLEHLKFKGKFEDETRENERRKKISDSAKKSKLSGGYRRGCGRGKKGSYKGFYCDSSYELAWVIYHLEHNITFERNIEKFEYLLNDTDKRYYIPDFKIADIYYEIKGYNHVSTYYKAKYFPHKLKILYAQDLKHIFEYVHNKYGKNFIYLYDDKKYKCNQCNGPICKENKTRLCIKCYRNNPTKRKTSTCRTTKTDICSCGNTKKKRSKRCISCKNYNDRKIKQRPDIEILLKELSELGYSATGRKYGVSDNCIRKWLKRVSAE